MPTHLGWQEIVLRLTFTVLAGAVVGLNRGEHGQPAGLRTTLLVCLAASVSMIQANLLLATAGRHPDSFIMLDVMRLPLGILTGMGFIGGGAILKKGDAVRGVTTAATLWFVTVMGLCFGGGQTALGLAALALGMFVLSGLKRLEALIPQDRRATLILTASLDGPTEDEVREFILKQGCHVASSGVSYEKDERRWALCCEVRWRATRKEPTQPNFVKELSGRTGVSRLKWIPEGLEGSWT